MLIFLGLRMAAECYKVQTKYSRRRQPWTLIWDKDHVGMTLVRLLFSHALPLLNVLITAGIVKKKKYYGWVHYH